MALDAGISGRFRSLFDDLKYLTDSLKPHVGNKGNNAKATSLATTLDLMTFSKTRTAIEHRILDMARSYYKPRERMSRDDYNFELCRLAALIYIKCALHMFLPVGQILGSLKGELMQLIEDGEKHGALPSFLPGGQILGSLKAELVRLIKDGEKHGALGARERMQAGSAIWGLLMGSLLSSTPEEEEWFAKRITEGTRMLGSMWTPLNCPVTRPPAELFILMVC